MTNVVLLPFAPHKSSCVCSHSQGEATPGSKFPGRSTLAQNMVPLPVELMLVGGVLSRTGKVVRPDFLSCRRTSSPTEEPASRSTKNSLLFHLLEDSVSLLMACRGNGQGHKWLAEREEKQFKWHLGLWQSVPVRSSGLNLAFDMRWWCRHCQRLWGSLWAMKVDSNQGMWLLCAVEVFLLAG